ncbi:MAG: hypothetical protein ABSE73_25065, partial [Planctomycetota bacterium]
MITSLKKFTTLVSAALSLALLAPATCLAATPQFGPVEVTLGGQPAPAPSAPVCGFSLLANGDGPQVALMTRPAQCVAAVRTGEEACITISVQGVAEPFMVVAEVTLVYGTNATAVLSVDDQETRETLKPNAPVLLEVSRGAGTASAVIRLKVSGAEGEAGVRWRDLRLQLESDRKVEHPKGVKDRSGMPIPLVPPPAKAGTGAAPALPSYCPAIEQALIEWDWRMQNGIDTERECSSYPAAIEQIFPQGDKLIAELRATGLNLDKDAREWDELRQRWQQLLHSHGSALEVQNEYETAWEQLWRDVHALRRQIALTNPLLKARPLVFVKQVPSAFSHQLTQYYGRYARPGGGVFVLEHPGETMQCRSLTAGALKEGSCQHLDVSYDARKLLFSHCECDTAPANGSAAPPGRYYHLYEVGVDGTGLRQLTSGPYDDFAPRYLPDGRLVFISTRRGGWHRCGSPGCENYTLACANGDGSNPHCISFHETQEWDPAVLSDGRIVYTRWDYVDRHAVYYEQLWTVRTDGSSPVAFYGNNTFNPVGV